MKGNSSRSTRLRLVLVSAGILALTGCQSAAPAPKQAGLISSLSDEYGMPKPGRIRAEGGMIDNMQNRAQALAHWRDNAGSPTAASPANPQLAAQANYNVRPAQYGAPVTMNGTDKTDIPKTPISARMAYQNAGPMPRVPFREQALTTLPTYTIEPPDILLIDAIKVVPKAPYHVEPLDQLQVNVAGALPEQPINGTFPVEPGGSLNLGATYGRVAVAGMTLEEVTHAIDQHLRRILREPEVSVGLLASAGQQQIQGEHLVGPDGNVNLGSYGTVYVVGLTLREAQAAIEQKLSKYLESPRVAVDVYAYNSKVYYVIAAGGGNGDIIQRFPVTGRETVLDALAQVNGISRAASKKIWIARPSPDNCDHILPVNYRDIVKGASTRTNYQVLPGDRIYIEEDHWIAADTFLAKIFAPIERVFGAILLGNQTVQNTQLFPGGRGTNN